MSQEQNRKFRRIAQKKSRTSSWDNKVKVHTEDQLLTEENELSVWSNTLSQYQIIGRFTQMKLQIGILMNTAGVSPDMMRKWYGYSDIGLSFSDFQQIVGLIAARSTKDVYQFESLKDSIRRFKTAYSNEDYEELWQLMRDPEIHPLDIVKESYRHTKAMIDLTSMHVRWLREVEKRQKSEAKKNNTLNKSKKVNIHQGSPDLGVVDSQDHDLKPKNEGMEVVKDSQIPFLEGVELFWTTKQWDAGENYLVSIDTSDRSRTVDSVADLVRGFASIKPVSVANALEFYTRKDIIQKALAARLRYVPDGLKDWARIKRGKDRIALQEIVTGEGQRRIVFFIEGRDQVYRGLNR